MQLNPVNLQLNPKKTPFVVYALLPIKIRILIIQKESLHCLYNAGGGGRNRSVVKMSDSGRDGGALRIDHSLCTPGGIAPGKWKERTPHPSCTMLREGREPKRCTLSVSLAIAEALRLANVGIICSYPITFQIPIVEFL